MKNKKIIIIAGLILSISTIIFISKNDTSSLIGAYIDGEYSSTIPGKDDGYVVEKIVCDNDATGKWNYSEWGILTTNMTKKSKCNIYFKKGIRLADTNTYVDDTGKCPAVNSDGTVNITGAESENSLLCSAPDNYGTSYYFRGNVQNNYVKFANFYWRIVRINGDGSIRLIYDGTSAHRNGEASEDRIIGISKFNELGNDNAYVGYMYGTPGSSTYEKTHANINDSTIKKYIDSWYENNLKNTKYEGYLADNIFCNDRSISVVKSDDEFKNTGISTDYTKYKWYEFYNQPVSFFCKQLNDSFSVSKSDYGNGSLTYPIALIDVDTAFLAGGFNNDNSQYYLYSGTKYAYWTLTPRGYTQDLSTGFAIAQDGNAYAWDGFWNQQYVKPVINLKPNSLVTGDGTINNPYTVE